MELHSDLPHTTDSVRVEIVFQWHTKDKKLGSFGLVGAMG